MTKIREKLLNYYWRTVSGQHCLVAEEDIGAPIFTSQTVRCALPIFIPIAQINWSLHKTETEIVEEKMTTKLKSKQTSIAISMVQNRLQTVASLSAPLPFHYPLPVSMKATELVSKSRC
jgi:hypothetical protein